MTSSPPTRSGPARGSAELCRARGPGRDPRDLDGPAPGGRHREVGPPEVQRDSVARADLVSLRSEHRDRPVDGAGRVDR